MKSDAVKTAAGFEAIKTKALQFPPDLIDIKPSVSTARTGVNSDAFETSTPPFYALRFLSSSTPASEQLKSRLAKTRAKVETEAEHPKEKNDKQLPTVELTISKKIKFPHDKKLAFGKRRHEESQLTASDRVIIEELRHHLRAQPRNGTTSVLEAIGDPEVREQRLYYEPLKTFLQSKEESGSKPYMDPGLRVVDIMIPSFEKRMQSDSGMVLPLTLSRHHAAVSRNANRFRGNMTFTFLPKVEGSSLIASADRKHAQTSQMRFYNPDIPSQETPAMYSGQKRKTQLNLPRIGMKRDEAEYDNTRVKFNKRKGVATVQENQQRSKAATVQLPVRQEVETFGGTNGFPRRATTTATGKSHLIGPMNKMDIIADYSKALQNGTITYNEYMKKLSVLSLHKVNLANSAQRHFHLIRDESNNMRPKLAHVDVNPSTTHLPSACLEQGGEMERKRKTANTSEKTTKISHASYSNNESVSEATDSLNTESKSGQSRLHRVDIGEGLSLFEKHKPGPDFSDDLAMTDLTRYTHVHHPRQNRLPHYHWNHEGASLLGADVGSQRHPVQWQISHQTPSTNMNSNPKAQETPRQEKELSKAKPKVLLSMEEYLQLHSPRHTASRPPHKSSLSAIGEHENKFPNIDATEGIKTMQESLEYIGKIPNPVDDSEPLGLGAKDLVKTVNFNLPGNPVKDVTDAVDEISDVDSVFQSHLDNMLKTIKKAKASKKRQVPELRGLVPTIVPQVRVETKKCEVEKEKQEAKENLIPNRSTDVNFLVVKKQIPENTPPPTADQKVSEQERGESRPTGLSVPQTENSVNHLHSMHSEKAPTVAEKSDNQLHINPTHLKPPTPKSVQSNRSFKVTVPGAVLEEGSGSLSNSEIRIMTASVDLEAPSSDYEKTGVNGGDRTRLEVVITSMPVAPPASIATTSEGSVSENEID